MPFISTALTLAASLALTPPRYEVLPLSMPGEYASSATGINDHGVAVGDWMNTPPGRRGAFVCRDGEPRVFAPPTLQKIVLNDIGSDGMLYGRSNVSAVHAWGFVANAGAITMLPPLSGYQSSSAGSANSRGVGHRAVLRCARSAAR